MAKAKAFQPYQDPYEARLKAEAKKTPAQRAKELKAFQSDLAAGASAAKKRAPKPAAPAKKKAMPVKGKSKISLGLKSRRKMERELE